MFGTVVAVGENVDPSILANLLGKLFGTVAVPLSNTTSGTDPLQKLPSINTSTVVSSVGTSCVDAWWVSIADVCSGQGNNSILLVKGTSSHQYVNGRTAPSVVLFVVKNVEECVARLVSCQPWAVSVHVNDVTAADDIPRVVIELGACIHVLLTEKPTTSSSADGDNFTPTLNENEDSGVSSVSQWMTDYTLKLFMDGKRSTRIERPSPISPMRGLDDVHFNETLPSAVIPPRSPSGVPLRMNPGDSVLGDATTSSDSSFGHATSPEPSNELNSATTTSTATKTTTSTSSKFPDNWAPQYGRISPLLYPFLLHRGKHRLISPNSPQAFKFENEVFSGEILLMVNSSYPMDPYFENRLAGDKNRFEIQAQGKFLKHVEGKHMFLGAEVTKRMELGMITRSICNTFVNFCRRLNPAIHHSFGDKQNIEAAHIASPFWSTMDRIIVTPPGETPPSIMEPFYESVESRHKRKRNPGFYMDVDISCTYSFSFRTSFMDMEQWSIVNIPLIKPVRLQSIISDADLKFFTYFLDPSDLSPEELGPTATAAMAAGGEAVFPKQHPLKKLQQIFSMELQHSSNHPEWANDPTELYKREIAAGRAPEQVIKLSNDPYWVGKPSQVGVRLRGSSIVDDDEDDEDKMNDFELKTTEMADDSDSSFDEDDFFDAIDDEDELLAATTAVSSTSVVQQVNPVSTTLPINNTSELQTNDERESTSILSPLREKAIIGHAPSWRHIDAVPTVIDVDEMRPGYKSTARRVLYAFRLPPPGHPVYSILDFGQNTPKYVLRSYKEWTAVLPVTKVNKPTNYYRLTKEEQRRLILSQSYEETLVVTTKNPSLLKKLCTFLSFGFHNDTFLTSNRPVGDADVMLHNTVAVRLGTTLWSQETIALTKDDVILRNSLTMPSTGRRNTGVNPTLRIALKNILFVKSVSVDDASLILNDTYLIIVSTFARQYELLFRGADVRDRWLFALRTTVDNRAPLAKHPLFSNVGEPLDNEVKDGSNGVMLARTNTGINDGTNSAGNASSVKLPGLPSSTSQVNLNTPSGLSRSISNAGHRTANQSFYSITSLLTGPAGGGGYDDPLEEIISEEGGISFAGNAMDLAVHPRCWVASDRAVNGDRFLLNARNFSIGSVDYILRPSSPLRRYLRDPLGLVAYLLELAFQLSEYYVSDDRFVDGAPRPDIRLPTPLRSCFINSQRENATVGDIFLHWIDFLDGVSLLQGVSLEEFELNEREKMCLFLNLYHLMVIHCFLTIGLPASNYHWTQLFRGATYEAFGDIFSLAELEHCILRASMTRPALVPTNFLPHTTYSFGLQTRDYRLLWAINSGSISNMPLVPIYTIDYLHQQLDAVVCASLQMNMSVSDSGTVMLPQTVLWYCRDLDPHANPSYLANNSVGTRAHHALLDALMVHLTGDDARKMYRIVSLSEPFSVLFEQFQFNCCLLYRGDFLTYSHVC